MIFLGFEKTKHITSVLIMPDLLKQTEKSLIKQHILQRLSVSALFAHTLYSTIPAPNVIVLTAPSKIEIAETVDINIDILSESYHSSSVGCIWNTDN